MLGLWRESLALDLFWRVRREIDDSFRMPISKFPSWSWLSATDLSKTPFVRGPEYLTRGGGGWISCIDILSFNPRWEREPFASPLKGSELFLSGLARQAALDTIGYDKSVGWRAKLIAEDDRQEIGSCFLDTWDPSEAISRILVLQLFQICVYNPQRQSPGCQVKTGILVLVKPADGRNEYRRIGTGWSSFAMLYEQWKARQGFFANDTGKFLEKSRIVVSLV
jgi:hypothetical protein